MDLTQESIKEVDETIEQEDLKKIEAALFIAGRFLSTQELVALTEINPILLKKTLEDLQDRYKDRGIEIINKNNQWKMDVSQEHIGMVNKLATGNSEFTKSEQESLAVIAYKQPMKQSVLIKIRGNKAYDHIKKFVSIGLITKKKLGHTSELFLADAFHEYFHVQPPSDKPSA